MLSVRSSSRPSNLLVATGFLAAAFLLPAAAHATTVVVQPGVGALQAAIDAASPGDVLVLKDDNGYEGAITIAKPDLTIVPEQHSSIPPTIGGGCADAAAITITADNVTLGSPRHRLIVQGGAETGVAVSGTSGLRLRFVQLFGCSNTSYGFDIQDSMHVRASDVSASGPFTQAALRLRNVAPPVRVSPGLNGERLLIVDSGDGTSRPGRSRITIEAPTAASTSLVDAHGIFFRALRDSRFATHDWICSLGAVDLDAQSTNNKFSHCRADSVVDDGTGNCAKDSEGLTLPPCG